MTPPITGHRSRPVTRAVIGRAAVLGRPIRHSLSPVLHRAAYRALGLDWTYEALDCGVADLPGVLAERADWAGFSCTMPLKHAVLDVATTVSPLAAAVGSANTLLPGETGWVAENTDVPGIVAALAERAVVPTDVTVLGAGGTAQAVLGALATVGVDACTVLVRDRSRAQSLSDTAARLGLTVTFGDLVAGAAGLDAGLVVSTVPVEASDLLAAVAGARAWRRDQAVLDVVYAPWPTGLAAVAAAGGAIVVSGALMLLHQAAAQVSAMTGRDAPVEQMRTALRAAVPDAGL